MMLKRRLFLMAVFFGFSCALAGEVQPDKWVVASFETPDEVSEVDKAHAGVIVEQSLDHVTHGKYSGKFNFGNDSFYPGTSIKFSSGDWSRYSMIEFDAYNAEEFPTNLYLVINRYTFTYTLPPGRLVHLTGNLEIPAPNLKREDVRRLWFWTRPPAEGKKVIYIDNICLLTPKGVEKDKDLREQRKKRELKVELLSKRKFLDNGCRLYPDEIINDSADEIRAVRQELDITGELIDNLKFDGIPGRFDSIDTRSLGVLMTLWREKISRLVGPAPDFAVGVTDCMEKMFRDRPCAAEFGKKATIFAAQNEYEPFQIVLVPLKDQVRNARLEFTDLIGPGGYRIDKGNIRYNFEAYLLPPLYERKGTLNFAYRPPYTGPFDQPYPKDGWPDILIKRETCSVETGFIQPVWITVYVPPASPPGEYQGKISVVAENTSVSIELNLNVWGFSLPTEPSFTVIANPRESRLSKFDKRSFEEIDDEITRNFADHKISLFPDDTRFFPKIVSVPGGAAVDFTEFDKKAHHIFDELNMKFIRFPVKVGYGIGFQYSLLGNYPFTEEKKAIFVSACKQVAAHLREKGWLHKTFLWLGESQNDADKELAALVKQADPGIKMFHFHLRALPFLDGYATKWGVYPSTEGDFILPLILERQRKSDEIWPFNCADEISFPGAVNRGLFWLCGRYGFPGMIYWTIGGWPEELHAPAPSGVVWGTVPTSSEDFGDGILYWPDRDNHNQGLCNSIRWELWRKGIDDYEYISILSRKISELKKKNKPEYKDTILESERVLAQSLDFVTLKNYFSRRISGRDIQISRKNLGFQIEKINRLTSNQE